MGRIGRIHTDLIRADPSDPPNPWSISPPNLASCLSQLDSNTQIGHYSNPNYLIFAIWYLRFVIWNTIANRTYQISNKQSFAGATKTINHRGPSSSIIFERGSLIVNVVPPPSLLSASIEPPCASTIHFDIASPNPKPVTRESRGSV
jgi:hypothetical protein